MLVRIVSMHFREDACDAFLEIFNKSHGLIRASKGCRFLELLRDENDPCHFMTHSHWESEMALEKYRSSELFKKTWALTKVLFERKAEAWSLLNQEIEVSS